MCHPLFQVIWWDLISLFWMQVGIQDLLLTSCSRELTNSLMVLWFWWSNSVINSWLSVDGMELIFTGFVCYCALDLWPILFIIHRYVLCCWVVCAQHWTFLFSPSSLLQRIGKRMGREQLADLTQTKLKDILYHMTSWSAIKVGGKELCTFTWVGPVQ